MHKASLSSVKRIVVVPSQIFSPTTLVVLGSGRTFIARSEGQSSAMCGSLHISMLMSISSLHIMYPRIGMKTERKLSDFSAEKRKWNGNTEAETEFCKTETETETFMRKRKRKRNNVFRRNDHGNGNSVSGNTELSVFYHVVLSECSRPNNFSGNNEAQLKI